MPIAYDEPASGGRIVYDDAPPPDAYDEVIERARQDRLTREQLARETPEQTMRRVTPDLFGPAPTPLVGIPGPMGYPIITMPETMAPIAARVATPLAAAALLPTGIGTIPALGLMGAASLVGEVGAQSIERGTGQREEYSIPQMAVAGGFGAAPGLNQVRALAGAGRLTRAALPVIEGAGYGALAPVAEAALEGELPNIERVKQGAAFGAALGVPFGAANAIPKSAQILAEPATKTPSIANKATEVATQTKGSPYALQNQLNQLVEQPVVNVDLPLSGQGQPGRAIGEVNSALAEPATVIPEIRNPRLDAEAAFGGAPVKSAEQSAQVFIDDAAARMAAEGAERARLSAIESRVQSLVDEISGGDQVLRTQILGRRQGMADEDFLAVLESQADFQRNPAAQPDILAAQVAEESRRAQMAAPAPLPEELGAAQAQLVAQDLAGAAPGEVAALRQGLAPLDIPGRPVTVASQVSAMDAPAFRTWASQQEGGFTTTALNTGREAAGNPTLLDELRAGKAQAEAEYNQAMQVAMSMPPESRLAALDVVSPLASKVQFFNEALAEAAKLQPPTPATRAIQEQSADASLLRQAAAEPEQQMGLSQLGEAQRPAQTEVESLLEETPIGDLITRRQPRDPVAAAQASALRRQRGAASPAIIAPVAGAAGGGTAGFTLTERQPGESEEEFQARRLRNAMVGAAGGAAGTSLITTALRGAQKNLSRANAIKSVQDEAIGRERMPEWYLKFRSSPGATKFREALNNSRARVKDLVAAIGKDVEVPDESNPYLAGKLFPGRSSERVRQAEETMRDVQETIVEAAKASGTPVDQFINRFNLWLEARHTPYYNAALKGRADATELGDAAQVGQHRWTDEQAAQVLAETSADGYGKVFDELAKEYANVTDATRELLVRSGLIDAQTAEAWKKTFPYYVPFNRVMPEDAGDLAIEKFVGGGPGMNVLGSGVYSIKGSDLQVADIGASIYANMIDAVRRAEKNRVDQAALNFFRGPGAKVPGVRIIKPGFMQQFDPATQVAVRENGQRTWIQFDDPKLATAFSNLNTEEVGGMLRLIATPTRWFSQLVTRFSPNFLLANPIRDRQEAALKLASQGDWGGAIQALNPARATQDAVTAAQWARGTQTPDTALFQQMLDDGGMAGGYASMTRKKAEDAVKEFRVSDVNPIIQKKDQFIKFVDFLTDISEGSTRFRAYKRALDLGATRDQAALAARNASVDFNQKGTVTPQASALWAFFNPAVQGPINSTKALIRNPETLATIATAFIGIGAAADAWNKSYDPEWKNKPTFQFSRTSGVPLIYGVDEKTGDYKFVTLPVAHALRPVKAVMDFMGDAGSGDIDTDNLPDELARVGGAVLDSSNPLGSSNAAVAPVPTIFRPLQEMRINEKFTGAPIVPQRLDADPLIEDRAKRFLSSNDTATGRLANNFSDFLYENFDVDVSPERMRYLIRQYSGGPGRAISDTANTVAKVSQDGLPEVRLSETPGASAFFRRVSPEISERESPEYKQAEEFSREVKTEDELKRQQARLFYRNYVEKVAPERRVDFLRAATEAGFVPVGDPVYLRTLLNLTRDGLKGRSETDNLISGLSIESGHRAQYYADTLQSMKPEERLPYLQEQAQKRLLTPEVMAQLDALTAR